MTGEPAKVTKFLRRGQDIRALRVDPHHVNEMLEAGYLWIETTRREFACKECQRRWWRNVPKRKQVSQCPSCHTRYEAIPHAKEWGLGQFYCDGENCGIAFQGFAVMNFTKKMCPRCGYHVSAHHIIPPESKKIARPLEDRIHDVTSGQRQGGIIEFGKS